MGQYMTRPIKRTEVATKAANSGNAKGFRRSHLQRAQQLNKHQKRLKPSQKESLHSKIKQPKSRKTKSKAHTTQQYVSTKFSNF
jgi:hypothetical protein